MRECKSKADHSDSRFSAQQLSTKRRGQLDWKQTAPVVPRARLLLPGIAVVSSVTSSADSQLAGAATRNFERRWFWLRCLFLCVCVQQRVGLCSVAQPVHTTPSLQPHPIHPTIPLRCQPRLAVFTSIDLRGAMLLLFFSGSVGFFSCFRLGGFLLIRAERDPCANATCQKAAKNVRFYDAVPRSTPTNADDCQRAPQLPSNKRH